MPLARSSRPHNRHPAGPEREAAEGCACPGGRLRKRDKDGRVEPSPGVPGQPRIPHSPCSPTCISPLLPFPADDAGLPRLLPSSAGVAGPQFRHKPASSGHVAAFLRANPGVRSTPWPQAPPPRSSEWLSPGRAGEQETTNGKCKAGSGPEKGAVPAKACCSGSIATGGAREPIPGLGGITRLLAVP